MAMEKVRKVDFRPLISSRRLAMPTKSYWAELQKRNHPVRLYFLYLGDG